MKKLLILIALLGFALCSCSAFLFPDHVAPEKGAPESSTALSLTPAVQQIPADGQDLPVATNTVPETGFTPSTVNGSPVESAPTVAADDSGEQTMISSSQETGFILEADELPIF